MPCQTTRLLQKFSPITPWSNYPAMMQQCPDKNCGKGKKLKTRVPSALAQVKPPWQINFFLAFGQVHKI